MSFQKQITADVQRSSRSGRSTNSSLRVLLIGEASGVHWTLKEALQDLGHHCDLLVQQEFGARYDMSLGVEGAGLVNQIKRNTLPLYRATQLENYDVISFLNTITSQNGRYTRYRDLPFLRKKCSVMSYYAVGCDELGLIMMNDGVLPYTPCATCWGSSDQLGMDCKHWIRDHHEVGVQAASKYFDCGFGSMIEYDHARKAFAPGTFVRVPFPVNVTRLPFLPPTPKPRPLVVHTPTRRGFKGTAAVLEAVKRLRESRDDFDFEVVEGLGYAEYLRVIESADVVVDQIYSQSPGMNALELMAMGKVVMTGATDVGRSYFPFMREMPAYDAPPDPGDLAREIGLVLDNRPSWAERAQRGRDYITRNHDRHQVAQAFLDRWQSVLQGK